MLMCEVQNFFTNIFDNILMEIAAKCSWNVSNNMSVTWYKIGCIFRNIDKWDLIVTPSSGDIWSKEKCTKNNSGPHTILLYQKHICKKIFAF